MVGDLNDGDDNPVRGYIRASIQSSEQLRRIEQLRAMEVSRLRPSPIVEENSATRSCDGVNIDLDQLAE